MLHPRSVLLAGMVLVASGSVAVAQRAVNTGAGTTERAMELGLDVASVVVGVDDPKSVSLAIGGQPMVRFAWFFSNAMAFEPAIRWNSTAQENSVGFSSYTIDFGLLYGLSSMDPSEKPWYVRPSIAISGGSGGQTSFTTLSGAFGMRRMMHGILMRNEVVVSQRLKSGSIPSATSVSLRHGISLRRQ